MTEEYKIVKNYPNYVISNLGNIKIKKNRDKPIYVDTYTLNNMVYVILKKVKVIYDVPLCVLLAEAFLEKKCGYLKHVKFKDNNSLNVTLDNLQWGNIQGYKDIKWEVIEKYPNYEICRYAVRNTTSKKILKMSTNTNGYITVNLFPKGIVFLHILMATQYIPNPLNKPEVNHIDTDKTNFNIENLEWLTGKENIEHARKAGLLRMGGVSKKIDLVDNDHNIIQTFNSIGEAANYVNVGPEWITKKLKKYNGIAIFNDHILRYPVNNIEGEIWKAVRTEHPLINNRYEVSNWGRIRDHTKHIMQLNIQNDKSVYITLRNGLIYGKDCKRKLFTVASLVISTFILNAPFNKKTHRTHHIDGDLSNNHVDNLEMMDHVTYNRRFNGKPLVCVLNDSEYKIFDCAATVHNLLNINGIYKAMSRNTMCGGYMWYHVKSDEGQNIIKHYR